MKVMYGRWLLAVALCFSLCAMPIIGEAYQCRWENGHKVCWHNVRHVRRCHWVRDHGRDGRYYSHKVCWYR